MLEKAKNKRERPFRFVEAADSSVGEAFPHFQRVRHVGSSEALFGLMMLRAFRDICRKIASVVVTLLASGL
jgi:hypothetical protein